MKKRWIQGLIGAAFASSVSLATAGRPELAHLADTVEAGLQRALDAL